jgi:hypothetical protein
MDSEIGILTREQAHRLFKLLASGNTYEIKNLDELIPAETKYFVQSKEHLFKIYRFRFDHTQKTDLKKDLEWLLANISEYEGNKVRLCFNRAGER